MNIQRGKCSKGRFQGKFSPRIIQSPHKQSTEVNESTFEVPSLLLFSNCSCPALCNPMDCSTPGFRCPPLSPRVCSNSCLLSKYLILPVFFSFCLQSFPASGSFPLSWLFTSGGKNTGPSASESVLPVSIQGWFPLGLTGSISCCPRDSRESSIAPQFKSINSLVFSLLRGPTVTSLHDYWKNHSIIRTFVSKLMSLLFNTLSRFVIALLSRSECLLTS